MGRRPNPQRRIELLDEIVDYLLEEGLSDLSLRPLANALGTSTYTLTYQFGSKDEMVVDTLRHIEHRQEQRLRRVAATTTEAGELVERLWEASGTDDGLRWTQLSLESTVEVARDRARHAEFEGTYVVERVARMAQILRRQGITEQRATTGATILIGALNGLITDLLATGDRARIEPAFASLVELARHWADVEPEITPIDLDLSERDPATLVSTPEADRAAPDQLAGG